MIVAAFVQLAESSRMDTLETDLFPEICNQVDHAVAERRALVAETCGSLCHFVKPELRSTLVLPVLKEVQDCENYVTSSCVCSCMPSVGLCRALCRFFHLPTPLGYSLWPSN